MKNNKVMLNESSVIRWNCTQSNRKVNEWLDRSVTFLRASLEGENWPRKKQSGADRNDSTAVVSGNSWPTSKCHLPGGHQLAAACEATRKMEQSCKLLVPKSHCTLGRCVADSVDPLLCGGHGDAKAPPAAIL